MTQERFKFRHVNELTGLLVLAVFALVVAGVLYSGQSQRWFAQKYAFDVLLPESGAFGLRRGDEVFIAGVSVGLVDDIRVGQDRRMKAHVKVRGDFERFVRLDSTAAIKKVFGVAGDSFVEITVGHGQPLPAHHAEITCLSVEELPAKMERMLEELRGELLPVVKKAGATLDAWTQLGTDLQYTQGELDRLLARLDNLATGVEQGKGTAGKLLTDTALADEAQQLLAQANEAMRGWQDVMTNLAAAVINVRNGTARLPDISEAIASETKNLPGLIQQTQTAMREVERLAEALQRHWLLRKYVDKTDPPPGWPQPAGQKPETKPLRVFRSPKGSMR
ncbi:MAG: MlaD family protein [Verrucomicrobia bacterium]|nr:MlaD family protein [Verrucomicrobiota bacterium]